MNQSYYKTDLGIVIVDNDSVRLKSCYKKTIITEEQFTNSNPIRLSKHQYLTELNLFFKNDKFKWEYGGHQFKKMGNFEFDSTGNFIKNYNIYKEIPKQEIMWCGSCFTVLYHGRLFYTFISGNYFPQMQLIDFHTKELTGKWTNIKNLSPVFNITTNKII